MEIEELSEQEMVEIEGGTTSSKGIKKPGLGIMI